MSDQPLDLEAIEARAKAWDCAPLNDGYLWAARATACAADVPALIAALRASQAEVKRLRVEVEDSVADLLVENQRDGREWFQDADFGTNLPGELSAEVARFYGRNQVSVDFAQALAAFLVLLDALGIDHDDRVRRELSGPATTGSKE
jgi:hypothetical protein